VASWRTTRAAAPDLAFGGRDIESSGPDQVTEVGRRYAHDLGDRRFGDLLLQEHPDLPLLAVDLGLAPRTLGAAE